MQLRTHPLIPTSLVAEFLDIENFFLSFEPWLRENYTLPLGLQKDQLYASLVLDF